MNSTIRILSIVLRHFSAATMLALAIQHPEVLNRDGLGMYKQRLEFLTLSSLGLKN